MGCLEGKTTIITGGNGGYGRDTALLFAQEGANVLICGRNEKTLEEARARVATAGYKVVAVRCDVSSEEDVKHLFEVAYFS